MDTARYGIYVRIRVGAFMNLGLAPFLQKVCVDDLRDQAIDPPCCITKIKLLFVILNIEEGFAEYQVRPTEERRYPAVAAVAAGAGARNQYL